METRTETVTTVLKEASEVSTEYSSILNEGLKISAENWVVSIVMSENEKNFVLLIEGVQPNNGKKVSEQYWLHRQHEDNSDGEDETIGVSIYSSHANTTYFQDFFDTYFLSTTVPIQDAVKLLADLKHNIRENKVFHSRDHTFFVGETTRKLNKPETRFKWVREKIMSTIHHDQKVLDIPKSIEEFKVIAEYKTNPEESKTNTV